MHEAAGEVEVLSVVRDVAVIVKRVTNDPSYRVVLFGSWASGTSRTRSDIDIGVQGAVERDRRGCWMMGILQRRRTMQRGTAYERGAPAGGESVLEVLSG